MPSRQRSPFTSPGRREGLRARVASALSLAAHGALFFAIVLRAKELPPSALELSPLRFSGQVFEIESVSFEEERGERKLDLKAPLEKKVTVRSPQADATQKEAKVEPSKNARQDLPAEKPAKTSVETSAKAAGDKEADAKQAVVAPKGAYGEEGPPAGTMDLYRAFLKTLPLAAKSDPRWKELPMGPAGSIRIRLTLDENSKLLPVEVLEEPNQPSPAHLRRMVTLNRHFLLHGRFAMGPQSREGTQVLQVTARVSETPADSETPDADGIRAFGLRGGSKPSEAYFTFFSGRHIELQLKRL